MKTRSYLPFLILIAFAIGCSSSGSSSNEDSTSGSAPPTCAADNADCFMNGLFILDEDGSEIELVTITQDLPSTASVGSAPTITGITINQDPMLIDDANFGFKFNIDFTDPQFARPGFCIQSCPSDEVFCSGNFRCARGFPDGVPTGTWKTFLGYNVGTPTATPQQLTTHVYPIVAPGTDSDGDGNIDTAGDEPIGILEDAIADGQNLSDLGEGTILVGDPSTVDQEIDQPVDTEGGTGTGGEGATCTSSGDCSGSCFSTKSCVPSIFGGSCSCSGNSTSGQCSSKSCNNAGGSCGDGVNGCCIGLACVNGTCEASGTTCTF